jgi:putative membrane protein
MKLFFRFVFMVLAVLAADYLISGISVDSIVTALIAGAALTIIQIIVKPVVKILTLPITIVTLGFFLLILNAVFFWFVSSLVPGMSVDTFVSAFLGSLIVSVLNWLFDRTVKKRD